MNIHIDNPDSAGESFGLNFMQRYQDIVYNAESMAKVPVGVVPSPAEIETEPGVESNTAGLILAGNSP